MDPIRDPEHLCPCLQGTAFWPVARDHQANLTVRFREPGERFEKQVEAFLVYDTTESQHVALERKRYRLGGRFVEINPVEDDPSLPHVEAEPGASIVQRERRAPRNEDCAPKAESQGCPQGRRS